MWILSLYLLTANSEAAATRWIPRDFFNCRSILAARELEQIRFAPEGFVTMALTQFNKDVFWKVKDPLFLLSQWITELSQNWVSIRELNLIDNHLQDLMPLTSGRANGASVLKAIESLRLEISRMRSRNFKFLLREAIEPRSTRPPHWYVERLSELLMDPDWTEEALDAFELLLTSSASAELRSQLASNLPRLAFQTEAFHERNPKTAEQFRSKHQSKFESLLFLAVEVRAEMIEKDFQAAAQHTGLQAPVINPVFKDPRKAEAYLFTLGANPVDPLTDLSPSQIGAFIDARLEFPELIAALMSQDSRLVERAVQVTFRLQQLHKLRDPELFLDRAKRALARIRERSMLPESRSRLGIEMHLSKLNATRMHPLQKAHAILKHGDVNDLEAWFMRQADPFWLTEPGTQRTLMSYIASMPETDPKVIFLRAKYAEYLKSDPSLDP